MILTDQIRNSPGCMIGWEHAPFSLEFLLRFTYFFDFFFFSFLEGCGGDLGHFRQACIRHLDGVKKRDNRIRTERGLNGVVRKKKKKVMLQPEEPGKNERNSLTRLLWASSICRKPDLPSFMPFSVVRVANADINRTTSRLSTPEVSTKSARDNPRVDSSIVLYAYYLPTYL